MVVRETCEALWAVLCKDFVKAPSSVAEWKAISCVFSLIALVCHIKTIFIYNMKFWIVQIFV